jgi:hypothetical protein
MFGVRRKARYGMHIKQLLAAALIGLGLCPWQTVQAETELEQRAAITEATKRSFLDSDLAALEQAASIYRTEKSRTVGGLWKLSAFYAGIDEAIDAYELQSERDVAFDALDKAAGDWVAKYPDSPTGHIVRSMVLTRRAWAHRGSGYASTVSDEAWPRFREYVAAARANLEANKAVASADPKWYEEMLIVARAQGWDQAQFENLLDEALEREPVYYPTYFMALEYLLPKWGGSLDGIEEFAQDAVRRTSQLEGDAMYARIYWYASQTQFRNDIFNNSLVDWQQMKAGFDDIISRYPDAWNLNNYAYFACMARDKAKTVELLERIGTSVVRQAWKPLALKNECAQWAARS